jgi:hypothetical protein
MLTLLKGRWNVLLLPSSKPLPDAQREDRLITAKTAKQRIEPLSVTQRKGRLREGWEVAVLAGGWMEGGAYPNDSKKARSSVYYSFSLSGLTSSLLIVIAEVSKVFRQQSNWWATVVWVPKFFL